MRWKIGENIEESAHELATPHWLDAPWGDRYASLLPIRQSRVKKLMGA
jgi:hypothetical protein